MTKIVLCDDNREDLERITEMLIEYQTLHKELAIEISTMESAGELMQLIDQGEGIFDIYILDVLMPDYNGIDIGHSIRRVSDSSHIIYITSSPEYAFGAFGVHAGGYLLKPVEREKLFDCLEHTAGRVQYKTGQNFVVKTKGGVVGVDISQIIKVENVSRIMRFYLQDNTTIDSVYIRQPFEAQLAELLQNPRFIQPHKSFVVNMDYVEKLLSHDFELSDGSVVPISRNNQQETKKLYLRYLAEYER